MSSDPDSFEEFFRRHFGQVVGFLMKIGFNFEDSRDAASEAMLRAYRAWSTINQPRSWIYKTAHRIAVKKTLRDRDGVARAVGAGWGEPQLIDPCAVVDDYAEVLTVLSALPKRQRLVMAWCLHDFSTQEIADLLGMAESTVRSHRRLARDRLRRLFETANLQRRDARSLAATLNDREVIDDVE